jgi:hypothetical protein
MDETGRGGSSMRALSVGSFDVVEDSAVAV